MKLNLLLRQSPIARHSVIAKKDIPGGKIFLVARNQLTAFSDQNQYLDRVAIYLPQKRIFQAHIKVVEVYEAPVVLRASRYLNSEIAVPTLLCSH